jgi:hypothetical protein
VFGAFHLDAGQPQQGGELQRYFQEYTVALTLVAAVPPRPDFVRRAGGRPVVGKPNIIAELDDDPKAGAVSSLPAGAPPAAPCGLASPCFPLNRRVADPSTIQEGESNMRAAAHLLAGIALLSLLACQPCNRTGMTASAAVRHTTITAPPGGGSREFVEVIGSNFAPNVPITLSFRQYPATDSSKQEFQEGTSTDGSGHFVWSKDLFLLPARNFSTDPNVDVGITVKENNSGCFALTQVKAGAILHPPL